MNRRKSLYAAPVPRTPPGLVELVEGLAKDVLKHDPADIYEFCAGHMRTLLQIRSEAQRRTSTALQDRITKAQIIIRERAKRRRENYEKNLRASLGDHNQTEGDSLDIRPSDMAEDALVSECSEKPPAEASRPRESVGKDLLIDHNNATQSGEQSNDHGENVTCEEIEINKCISDVSGGEFTKDETEDSPDNENISPDLTNGDHAKAATVATDADDDAESEAKSPGENTNGSCDDASDLKTQDEQDHMAGAGESRHQMDLETAAITIQKVFRTFLFKSKTASLEDATNVDINLFIDGNNLKNDPNKERRALSRMDTVLQTVNEEKSLSLSTEDSSTLSSAATVIQAHIRGFLVRNKLNVNKAPNSAESILDSKECSCTSFETNNDPVKAKTVLNIHIVPERDHFASRDESLRTSMDFSMDDSSLLMPLQASYDITERRKQLKREDAVQSVSPPSNASSSKISEDIDSVACDAHKDSSGHRSSIQNPDQSSAEAKEIQTAVEKEQNSPQRSPVNEQGRGSPLNDLTSNSDSLLHSSEFHEVVLPTKVTRSDTSIVRGGKRAGGSPDLK